MWKSHGIKFVYSLPIIVKGLKDEHQPLPIGLNDNVTLYLLQYIKQKDPIK